MTGARWWSTAASRWGRGMGSGGSRAFEALMALEEQAAQQNADAFRHRPPPAAPQAGPRLRIAFGGKDSGFSFFLLPFYNLVLGVDAARSARRWPPLVIDALSIR